MPAFPWYAQNKKQNMKLVSSLDFLFVYLLNSEHMIDNQLQPPPRSLILTLNRTDLSQCFTLQISATPLGPYTPCTSLARM